MENTVTQILLESIEISVFNEQYSLQNSVQIPIAYQIYAQALVIGHNYKFTNTIPVISYCQ